MSSDSLTVHLPEVSLLVAAADLPVAAAEQRAELRASRVKVIRRAHRKCLGGNRRTLEHARDAGLAGLELKALVTHGEWRRFVHKTLRGQPSLRALQGYMRIAEGWDELASKTKRVSFLGIQEALRFLAKLDRLGGEPNPKPGNEIARPTLRVLAEEVLGVLEAGFGPEKADASLVEELPAATDGGSEPRLPGRVLLQPPRGGALREWLAELRAAYPARIEEALVLLPPRTDTQAFVAVAELASCLAFLKASLPQGPSTRGIVAYLGDRVATFVEVFDEHALLLFPRP